MAHDITRLLSGAALATILMTGAAFAQTGTYTATDASGTGTGAASDTSATAGVPNTGAGGDVATNVLLLGGAVAAFAAAAYAMRRRNV